jgi:hypothetical protein
LETQAQDKLKEVRLKGADCSAHKARRSHKLKGADCSAHKARRSHKLKGADCSVHKARRSHKLKGADCSAHKVNSQPSNGNKGVFSPREEPNSRQHRAGGSSPNRESRLRARP